jgi:LPXTG-motif cell wall-anchored protein
VQAAEHGEGDAGTGRRRVTRRFRLLAALVLIVGVGAISATAQGVGASAPVATPELPRTGSDLVGFAIGGLLVSAGIVVSWFARRRYS